MKKKTLEIHTAILHYQTHTVKLYKFNSFLTYLWEASGYSKKKRFRRINVKYCNIFLITLYTFITRKTLPLYPQPVFSDLSENSSAGFLLPGSKASQSLIGQYFMNFRNEKDHYLGAYRAFKQRNHHLHPKGLMPGHLVLPPILQLGDT